MKMQQDKNPEPHRLQLTTITPLSIGDEGVLSPLSDFVVQNGKVHYVDQAILEEELEKLDKSSQQHFIDKYVNGVKSSMNQSRTRSEFNFENFLQKDLRLTPDIYARRTYDIFGIGRNAKIQIVPIVHNAGKAYVPGSSIKGAIKTAILYYWLINTSSGKKELDYIIEQINNAYNRHRNDIETRDRLQAERDKDRRNFDSYKDKKLRDCRNRVKSTSRRLASTMDTAIDKLFGRVKDKKRMDFSLLRVSDTSTLPINAVEVHYTQRISLAKGTPAIPQCRETIKANQTSNFSIKIIPQIKHPELQYLNKNSLEELFKVINEFSFDNLDYDSEIVDNIDDKTFNQNKKGFNQLIEFYDDLMEVTEDNTHAAYLRLGAGKTYYHNSIGLAIYNQDADVLKKMVKLFGMGKPGQKLFPITRTVCMHGFQQLGWVKISKQNIT